MASEASSGRLGFGNRLVTRGVWVWVMVVDQALVL